MTGKLSIIQSEALELKAESSKSKGWEAWKLGSYKAVMLTKGSVGWAIAVLHGVGARYFLVLLLDDCFFFAGFLAYDFWASLAMKPIFFTDFSGRIINCCIASKRGQIFG